MRRCCWRTQLTSRRRTRCACSCHALQPRLGLSRAPVALSPVAALPLALTDSAGRLVAASGRPLAAAQGVRARLLGRRRHAAGEPRGRGCAGHGACAAETQLPSWPATKSDALSRDQMDRTPLHAAAERGQVDVVRMLALHGASLKVRRAADTRPIHFAVAALRSWLPTRRQLTRTARRRWTLRTAKTPRPCSCD